MNTPYYRYANLLIVFFLVILLAGTGYAAFPGARIAYKTLDGRSVGICDPNANELLDYQRASGQKSQSGTFVSQSCHGNGIAFSSPCNPNITAEKDDPYVRYTQDQQGYDKYGVLGPRQGSAHKLTIIPADANLPASGKRSITLTKRGDVYWVRIFDKEGRKAIDQSLDSFLSAASSDNTKGALADIKKRIEEWYKNAHNETTAEDDQDSLDSALANTLLITDYTPQGDLVYVQNANETFSPQLKPNSERSCSKLNMVPMKPFAVGIEFAPQQPPTQADNTSWPTITRYVNGPPTMPDRYLDKPATSIAPAQKGVPVYDIDMKQVNPSDFAKLDYSAGVGGEVKTPSGSFLYESVSWVTYTRQKPALRTTKEDNALNEECVRTTMTENSIIYQQTGIDPTTRKPICQPVMEPNILIDPCTKLEYNLGDVIRTYDDKLYAPEDPKKVCFPSKATSKPILATSLPQATQVPGSLYHEIFSNEAPGKIDQIQKLPGKIVDVEVGKTNIIHEPTGIVFEVRLENGKACVYAYNQLNPNKQWRVEKDFATSKAEVEDKLSITGIPCKSNLNECVNGVCVAASTANPGPGVGEFCILPKESKVDKSSSLDHCVDAPPPLIERHTLTFSGLISEVCTDYSSTSVHSHSKHPFLSVIVQCIEDSVENIFYPPPGAPTSFFDNVRGMMQGLVRTALTIYVIIFAYTLMIGKQTIPGRAKATWFVLQFCMVVYFAIGTGMLYLFPKFVTVSKELSIMVMEAGLGMNPADEVLQELQARADDALKRRDTLKQKYETELKKLAALDVPINESTADLENIDKQIQAQEKELVAAEDAYKKAYSNLHSSPLYDQKVTAEADYQAKKTAYDAALKTYNDLLNTAVSAATATQFGVIPAPASDVLPRTSYVSSPYTVPLLCNEIEVELWGGGSAARKNAVNGTTIPGEAGDYVRARLAVQPGMAFNQQVGRGGGGYKNTFESMNVRENASIPDGTYSGQYAGYNTQFLDSTGKPILFALGADGQVHASSAYQAVVGSTVLQGIEVHLGKSNLYQNTTSTTEKAGQNGWTSTTTGSVPATGQDISLCAATGTPYYAGRATGPGSGGCVGKDAFGGGGNGRIQVNCTKIVTKPTYDDLIGSASQGDQKAVQLLLARNALHDAQVMLWKYSDVHAVPPSPEVSSFKYYCQTPNDIRCPNPTAVLPAGGNENSPLSKINTALLQLNSEVERTSNAVSLLRDTLDQLREKRKNIDDLRGDRVAQKNQVILSVEELQAQFQAAQAQADTTNTSLTNALMQQSDGSNKIPNTGYGYCDFRYTAYTPGYESLKLWDMIDCKLSKYMGIGDNPDNASVPQVLWIGLLSVVSTGYGIPIFIFTLILVIFIILVSCRMVHIYIMAFISLALLVYISPLLIPAVLFERTKTYFKKWYSHIISYILQPVILFGFLSFMFAISDQVFFGGNHHFDADNHIISTAQFNANNLPVGSSENQPLSSLQGENGANAQDTECDDTKAMGCLYQTLKTSYFTLPLLEMRVYQVDFKGSQDQDLFVGLLQLIAVVFIAYFVMQLAEELSGKLTGNLGIAATISSVPVLPIQQSVNIIGGALKGGQEVAIGAVERTAVRLVAGAPGAVSKTQKRMKQKRSPGLFAPSGPSSVKGGGMGAPAPKLPAGPVPGENPKSPLFTPSPMPTPAKPVDAGSAGGGTPLPDSQKTSRMLEKERNQLRQKSQELVKDMDKLKDERQIVGRDIQHHISQSNQQRSDLITLARPVPGLKPKEITKRQEDLQKQLAEHDKLSQQRLQVLEEKRDVIDQAIQDKRQEREETLQQMAQKNQEISIQKQKEMSAKNVLNNPPKTGTVEPSVPEMKKRPELRPPPPPPKTQE